MSGKDQKLVARYDDGKLTSITILDAAQPGSTMHNETRFEFTDQGIVRTTSVNSYESDANRALGIHHYELVSEKKPVAITRQTVTQNQMLAPLQAIPESNMFADEQGHPGGGFHGTTLGKITGSFPLEKTIEPIAVKKESDAAHVVIAPSKTSEAISHPVPKPQKRKPLKIFTESESLSEMQYLKLPHMDLNRIAEPEEYKILTTIMKREALNDGLKLTGFHQKEYNGRHVILFSSNGNEGVTSEFTAKMEQKYYLDNIVNIRNGGHTLEKEIQSYKKAHPTEFLSLTKEQSAEVPKKPTSIEKPKLPPIRSMHLGFTIQGYGYLSLNRMPTDDEYKAIIGLIKQEYIKSGSNSPSGFNLSNHGDYAEIAFPNRGNSGPVFNEWNPRYEGENNLPRDIMKYQSEHPAEFSSATLGAKPNDKNKSRSR